MTTVKSIGLTGLAVLALVACEKKGACDKGVVATLSDNHGHRIEIPADAVKRGIGGTYPVTGGDHKHAVYVKDEAFAKLQKGETVTTRTSSVEGHVHEVTLSCAK